MLWSSIINSLGTNGKKQRTREKKLKQIEITELKSTVTELNSNPGLCGGVLFCFKEDAAHQIHSIVPSTE